MKPFLKAKPILQILINAGHEAYFVGGSVRDYLLQRAIHDIDIATSAKPEEIQALFSSVIPVGIEHGTVIVVQNGESYEVTTFRKESDYTDFRRPSDVTFISSLHEDLKRRDFTMNAIAMTTDLQLIDPYRGQEDIHNMIIRTVGSPAERFQEDPLRILRAIRFVSDLNFSIEKKTLRAIDTFKSYLSHLSVERISQEFVKLMLGQANREALTLISNYKINHHLPCLQDAHAEIEKMATLPLSLIEEPQEGWVILLFLIDRNERTFLKAWKQPNQLIQQVDTLLRELHDNPHDWKPMKFYRLGWTLSLSFARIYSVMFGGSLSHNINRAKEKYNALPIKNRKDLVINGNDLMSLCNKRPGPWLKEALQLIEEAVVSGSLQNEENKLREWVKKWDNQFGRNS